MKANNQMKLIKCLEKINKSLLDNYCCAFYEIIKAFLYNSQENTIITTNYFFVDISTSIHPTNPASIFQHACQLSNFYILPFRTDCNCTAPENRLFFCIAANSFPAESEMADLGAPVRVSPLIRVRHKCVVWRGWATAGPFAIRRVTKTLCNVLPELRPVPEGFPPPPAGQFRSMMQRRRLSSLQGRVT